MPGLDHRVALVEDHDKVLEQSEVHGVRGVLLRLLVVYLGNEAALLHVFVRVEGVVPVLGLHEKCGGGNRFSHLKLEMVEKLVRNSVKILAVYLAELHTYLKLQKIEHEIHDFCIKFLKL